MNRGLKVVNSGVFIAALIGIFALIVLISGKAPWRWDWTQTGVNSLSAQTKETLKGLKETVRVYAFTDNRDTGRQVERLLRAYQKETDKLDVRFVDPVKEPSLAQKYQVQEYNTVVFVKGEKEETVAPWDLFVPGAVQGSYGFRGEEHFTQAIRNLTSSQKPVIYLLQGHGEVSGADAAALRSDLMGEGNQVKELNLIRETRVPEDADVLVIAGPTSDLTGQEAKMINRFLDGGGKVLIALSPEKGMSKWKNMNGLLKRLGIRASGDLVVDPERAYYGDPLTPVPQYVGHDITSELMERDMVTVLPRATSLDPVKGSEEALEQLLETSRDAFGETSWASEEARVEKGDEDRPGPLTLAYAVTAKKGGGKGEDAEEPRAVVVGSSAMFSGNALTLQGNRDFVLNAVGWLQGDETKLTIRPVEMSLRQAYVPAGEALAIFLGTVVLLPIIFLIAGGVIWWRRRRA
jgi:ABC-type uncharacterized transport system involved in gliding motility auxiliary subunit